MAKYSEAVETLLTLGDVRGQKKWQDYGALGITQEDVLILLELMVDPDLNDADSETTEVWAPLHAWRALAQMRTLSMIDPYLELLDRQVEDDWIHEDLFDVSLKLGPLVVPKLIEFMADPKRDVHGRICMVEALEKMALKFVEVRRPVVDALTAQLRLYPEQDEGLNGFLIEALEALRVRNTIPLIAEVFAANKVEYLTAAWESVAETFRLPARSKPADYL